MSKMAAHLIKFLNS